MANFLSQKWLLPRRHFLRGLGVSLGLPMLDCMRPLRATEASEQPRRSIFVYLPNGVNTHDYELTQAGPDYEFSRILAPLAKHKGNISPISGLHHPNAFGIAHSATQTWLTAAKHGPTDRNTISVDQLIASVTGPQTRFSSLQISNQGQPLAVSADGIALPAHRQSGDAFKALFTEPKGGIEKQRRRLQRRESMLDLVLEDANVLANKLDLEDRGRLDQYLTAVREVEVRTKLFNAIPSLTSVTGSLPGTVLDANDISGLRVATGQGALEIGEVQPSGKKRMSTSSWIRGRGTEVGQRFQ